MAYPDAREGEGDGHVIRYLYGNARGALTVPDPAAQLAVGTLQSFLDRWMEGRSGVSLDYIHGAEVVEELTQEAGGMIVQTIDLDEVAERRATMPSLKDRHPEDYGVFCAPVKAEY